MAKKKKGRAEPGGEDVRFTLRSYTYECYPPGTLHVRGGDLDPRGFKVWPISAPRDEEARQQYLCASGGACPRRASYTSVIAPS